MKELFTKEEIEKYGFIYEPDVTKCKTTKTGPHYKCNYYKDDDLQFREVVTMAFFYGYSQALEEVANQL